MMKEYLRIVTTDGFVLSATRFSPESPTNKIILINSATGVKQKFYAAFAGYLTKDGYTVYTYDYRGIGHSKPQSLRGFSATMRDWGTRDYHSMLLNIFQSHIGARVIVIGHSVGGQVVALSPLSEKIDAAVMIGAQTPFIENFGSGWERLKLLFFWYLLIPVLTKIFGFFPAAKLNLFEDLPSGVALQWARWAKSQHYLFDEFPADRVKFDSLQIPALMVSFSDDNLAPPKAVNDLMQNYSQVKWTHWQINPEDVLQKSIGHFGFFKKDVQQSLWAETTGWMGKLIHPKSRKAA